MTKKRILTSLMLLAIACFAKAQENDFFTPYKDTKLRMPSVPLLVNDPYYSIWSPCDKLTDNTTRHWDDQQKAMDGLLRVDGQVYRFMGKQRPISLKSIAPMGNHGPWEAKVRYTSVPSTWTKTDFNDASWKTEKGPWGSKGEYPYINTSWTGDNKDIYIRRHVELTAEDINKDLWLIYSHDDKCEIYINGNQIVATDVSWKQNVRLHLENNVKSMLHEGDNVIAFHVHNTNGGSQADLGLYMNTQGYHGGMESIAPMADEGAWTAPVTHSKPASEWTDKDYNDDSWNKEQGAFGSETEYPNIHTPWTGDNKDVYIRRHVTLSKADLNKELVVIYSHDDKCEIYLNGRRLVATGETWVQNVNYTLTESDKAVLVEGDNVIAYHVHNTTGGAQADIGLYAKTDNQQIAVQKARHVLATSTYYTFQCGGVNLDLVFTAPMLMDDLDLLSTPINYISYRVTPNDGKEHQVQFYFGTSPELTVNDNNQPTISTIEEQGNLRYIKSGSKEQNVLGRAGDHITIDWGYLYIPAILGDVTVADATLVTQTFAATGTLPEAKTNYESYDEAEMPTLAYVHDFGSISNAENSHMMVGYDEVRDIRYMDIDYKGYWARNGKDILSAFKEMEISYDDIMARCKQQDQTIYDDALNAGNAKYAELLSGCYRHCIAAHKLFQDNKGNLLFFSKENDSNGCVNTVDLTYPEAPLFLIYNTDLQKGMCTSILEYCESSRWGFDFAAHDLGTYPHANNQVYSIRFPDNGGGFAGNMPIEESGNIVILAAAISLIDGNVEWASKYWNTLSKWTKYLAENGQDPANQLCTDDFAGHLAHNANLSIKAIMGVAGYALMARMKGETETYEAYMSRAQEMAAEWVKMAKDGNHYKLAFDKPGTWSQKYNLVWDKLWGLKLFPETVMNTEMSYYLTKQGAYGLPLDSRDNYTKTDWISWTATMARTKSIFLMFMDPLYKYANETHSRVPLSDWYRTSNGDMVGFRARSVVGGHWMKVLYDKIQDGTLMTGIYSPSLPQEQPNPYITGIFNLNGQRLSSPQKGVNVINGKKVMVK